MATMKKLVGSIHYLLVKAKPFIKDGSASARTKPEKLLIGLIVQVPEHISTGNRIRVKVEERRLMSRA